MVPNAQTCGRWNWRWTLQPVSLAKNKNKKIKRLVCWTTWQGTCLMNRFFQAWFGKWQRRLKELQRSAPASRGPHSLLTSRGSLVWRKEHGLGRLHPWPSCFTSASSLESEAGNIYLVKEVKRRKGGSSRCPGLDSVQGVHGHCYLLKPHNNPEKNASLSHFIREERKARLGEGTGPSLHTCVWRRRDSTLSLRTDPNPPTTPPYRLPLSFPLWTQKGPGPHSRRDRTRAGTRCF